MKISSQKLPCGRPKPSKEAKRALALDELRILVDRLNEYVREKGLKSSEARQKILEVIFLEARHFSPLELVDRLRKKHPEIGRATLYRNLPILVAAGTLQQGPQDSSGQSSFELANSHHHDHLVCLDCDSIFEFHDEKIESRQNKISNGMKFSVDHHSHVVYGRCQYLNKKLGGFSKGRE